VRFSPAIESRFASTGFTEIEVHTEVSFPPSMLVHSPVRRVGDQSNDRDVSDRGLRFVE
jgi:hypothetical protein